MSVAGRANLGLQKPFRVSPLIKFTRWSLLLCGIVYGQNKLIMYRAIDKRMAPVRHNILDKIREDEHINGLHMLTDLIKLLSGIVGLELPPDYKYTD